MRDILLSLKRLNEFKLCFSVCRLNKRMAFTRLVLAYICQGEHIFLSRYLYRNRIRRVHWEAFHGLKSLKVL